MSKTPRFIEDCPTFDLVVNGKNLGTVQGYSRAGDRTGYFVSLEGSTIMFDCGMESKKKADCILITHRHHDHYGALVTNVSYRAPKVKGQDALMGRPVLMPTEMKDISLMVGNAHIWASTGKPLDNDDSEGIFRGLGMHPFPVHEGMIMDVPGIKEKKIEVLPCHHGDCTCVGYGISIIRKKIKSQYEGLSGKELGILRKTGTVLPGGTDIPVILAKGDDISEEISIPVVAFFGDTTPDALLKHEEWKKYPNLFIECTTCDYQTNPEKANEGIATSRERGHTHINELLPIIENFPHHKWFIQHIGLGANIEQVKDTFSNIGSRNYVLVLSE